MQNDDPADDDHHGGPFHEGGVRAFLAALRREDDDGDTQAPSNRSGPPGGRSGPRERIRLPRLDRARGGGDPEQFEHDEDDPRRLAEQIVNPNRKPRMTGSSIGNDGEVTEY